MHRFAALAFALGIAGCGTNTSPHYHPPTDAALDTVAIDASQPVDVAPEAAPVVDARAGHGPPYPVVLAHGFAGWRQFGPVDYFYGVAADLRAHGETVYEAEVSPFDSSEVRGAQLANYVDHVLADSGSAKVVVVAHSQGGLDARYMISTLRYADRVAALVTVATPHRGTMLADTLLSASSSVTNDFLNSVATLLGFAYNDVHSQADLAASLRSLSTANAAAFNAANADDPRVAYWSWAGRSNYRVGIEQCAGGVFANDATHTDAPFALLAPFCLYLEQGDPIAHVNDGLVEVASAKWGQFQGCMPADHFDEIGQVAVNGPDPSSGFDHVVFYRSVVARLRGAGF